MERTFIAVKPDGVQRGLIGEIIGRFERKGYKLVAMKFMGVSRDLAEHHYGEHVGKPFFPGLVDFITSGPLVAMVWEGNNIIAESRKLIGATNPQNAVPGTIRADLAVMTGRNIIHGSDGPESAPREIALFFRADELVEWEKVLDHWVIE